MLKKEKRKKRFSILDLGDFSGGPDKKIYGLGRKGTEEREMELKNAVGIIPNLYAHIALGQNCIGGV